MTTATFPSRFGFPAANVQSSGRVRSEQRPAGFSPARPLLDAGDFSAVAFAFAFAAGLVLGGAVACDAYLSALISRGPATLDDLAAYQLAQALLPWSLAFTIIAGGLAVAGLRLACILRHRSVSTGPAAGFGLRASQPARAAGLPRAA